MLILVSVELAQSIKLVLYRAWGSDIVTSLSRPPLTLLAIWRAIPVISYWRSVAFTTFSIPFVWKTSRDHLDSPIVIEVSSGSFPSSIEVSVAAVVIVLAIVL